jgi:hypothetical protein
MEILTEATIEIPIWLALTLPLLIFFWIAAIYSRKKALEEEIRYLRLSLREHCNLSNIAEKTLLRFDPNLAPILIKFAAETGHLFSIMPKALFAQRLHTLSQKISELNKGLLEKNKEKEKLEAVLDVLKKESEENYYAPQDRCGEAE